MGASAPTIIHLERNTLMTRDAPHIPLLPKRISITIESVINLGYFDESDPESLFQSQRLYRRATMNWKWI